MTKRLSEFFCFLGKIEKIFVKWLNTCGLKGADAQMPTTKNIERQMVSVGDPISEKNATFGLKGTDKFLLNEFSSNIVKLMPLKIANKACSYRYRRKVYLVKDFQT